jgi:hypothetical protein
VVMVGSRFLSGNSRRIFFAVGARNGYAHQNQQGNPAETVVRFRSFMLPALIAFLFAGATCWHLAGAASEPAAPPKVPGPPNAASVQFQLQGAGSCAAAACHNADTHSGVKGREYGLAMERGPAVPRQRVKDRHAQAYEVLFEKRSREIERKLHPQKKHAGAETDEVCLRCHVHPNFDTQPVRVEHGIRQFRMEDGVSCEACHGPAQEWLATHFRSARTDAERLAQGQYDTRSLRGRIEICVNCHVGAPGMEVNHDLIAAGHPRLTFEFSGFQFLLHKHWDSAKDTDNKADPRGQEDFETRAWLLGQVISARASLALLAHRAEQKTDGVWPEFAEHDCAACHHDLRVGSNPIKGNLAPRKRVILPQSRWYVAMVPQALEGLGVPADKKLLTLLDGIRKGLESMPPRSEPIVGKARQAAAILANGLDAAERIQPETYAAEKRFASMLFDVSSIETDDEAVQFFLASTTLSRARKDLQPALVRPTMRLLLQLPTSDRWATIDSRDYRKTLDALKKGSGIKAR